ncbi:MAG: NAD-dependent epimerase/dehydratase family protein [Nanoarchaeota archaeon]|nr:NAD-dependent epimerase/dehydratase family protein [Nanoarchaeota archaeon]
MKCIVTGGAGFIGSHLVDRLLLDETNSVIVVDNFSTGSLKNIQHNIENSRMIIKNNDLGDLKKTIDVFRGAAVVFHLAANADVRYGLNDNFRDIDRNLITTYNVLEAMRINNISKIIFISSAAIYGEPDVFPTPESYHPKQTSFYGASKIAAEALIEAFCEAYGMQAWIYRLVSIQGDRYSHGVTFDFFNKLKQSPHSLEILGNGTARKSFIHVNDCIEAIMTGYLKSSEKINIFNVGHDESISVTDIANMIVDELELKDVKYTYSNNSRGWIGDSPLVLLDTGRIKLLGWSPSISIAETIKSTVRWLENNNKLI